MVAASSLAFAASSFFALSAAAPVRSLVERATYKVYGGDGTVAQGWPEQSAWMSFDNAWTAAEPTIMKSCSGLPGSPPDNTQAETDAIKSAITSIATKSSLPAEFLLAIMMQESKGCVRVQTTNYGVNNPGLFQDFNGAHTCNVGGKFTTPCPDDEITGMVSDGAGIGLTFGLTQALTQSKATDVSKFYKGARIYNSGSIAPGGNLGEGVATHCYASDVANRLLGWVDGGSTCDENTIGSVQGSSGGGSGSTTGPSKEQPSSSATPTGSAPKSTPTGSAPQSTPTGSTSTGGGSATPSGPLGQGTLATGCTKYYTVKAGDSCESTGISFSELQKLNTGIDATCQNLWVGSSYCVAA